MTASKLVELIKESSKKCKKLFIQSIANNCYITPIHDLLYFNIGFNISL